MIPAEQAKQIADNVEFCLLKDLSNEILEASKNGNTICYFDVTSVSIQHKYFLAKKLEENGYLQDTVYDDNKIYFKVNW